jgi:hypothetical protein
MEVEQTGQGRCQPDEEGQHEADGRDFQGDAHALDQRSEEKLALLPLEEVARDPVPLPLISQFLAPRSSSHPIPPIRERYLIQANRRVRVVFNGGKNDSMEDGVDMSVWTITGRCKLLGRLPVQSTAAISGARVICVYSIAAVARQLSREGSYAGIPFKSDRLLCCV